MRETFKVPSDVLGYTAKKLFGQGSKAKASSGEICIDIITDENPQLIRLFGVMVDLISGNMAFGMFPNPEEYICIGNLFTEIASMWGFEKKKIPKGINMSYIIELLKLEPDYYKSEIQNEVFDGFKLEEETRSLESESILVNLVRDKFQSPVNKLDYFQTLCTNNQVISVVARYCLKIAVDCEDVSKKIYGAFICESSDSEIKENALTGFDLTRMKGPNTEALFLKYLTKGYPSVLLKDARSYGYRIKERRGLLNKGAFFSTTYTDDEVIDIGKAFSSMFYARKVAIKEKQFAHNFIDLMRAVGWEQNIYFALDIIVEYQSKAMWESLMNKFHVYDILSELGMSEKEFVIGISEYRTAEMERVHRGACYGRFTTLAQYKYPTFSLHQIKEAGAIFESSFNMLKKIL